MDNTLTTNLNMFCTLLDISFSDGKLYIIFSLDYDANTCAKRNHDVDHHVMTSPCFGFLIDVIL